MNNEYYGAPTTTSEDFLAHYGVKGMKWGVRRAIDRGNQKALSRQYRKASKKLAKLNNKANPEYNKKQIDLSRINQRVDAAIGGASVGASAGLTAHSLQNAYRQAMKSPLGIGTGNVYVPVGAGVAAVDAIGHQIRKKNARKRLTSEGRRAAQKKANDFRREMQKSFKGTQYANKLDSQAKEYSAKKMARMDKTLNAYGGLIGRSSVHKKKRK